MSRNTQQGGMIAEDKQLSGTSTGSNASLGSYFQGVASYLPSSIKKQLHISPASHHHSFDDDHDIVLGAEFDRFESLVDGESHLCLNLTYNNGFQVWDLQHADGVKRELLSVREPVPIKAIKFLPNPIAKEAPNSLLAGKRPLLAVISAEESTKFPRTNVKFFSLRVNDYINILRFKSPVYSIECNSRLLLVGLRDNIYGFDLVTMERVLSVPCYPSPSQTSVMALGPRWLAYAANQAMAPAGTVSPQSTHPPHSNSSNGNTSNLVDVAKDVASDLAKEVAQGLFYLGDMGRKTVSNYLYPDDQPIGNNGTSNLQVTPTEYKDTEHAGTIIIYDIITKKSILHFKAHSQPLSLLRFDPSGTILVTSSIDGHNFNVFQLGISGGNTGELSYRHLYKLVRGVTSATIQDISFSADSKWMAVSSTRGTNHLYAISPQGGAVNVLTHVPAINRPADLLSPHKPDLPVPLITLSVCNRIKTSLSASEEGTTRTISTIGSISRFVGLSPADERLLVFAKNGILTLYQLIPHAPTQPDLDPLSLQLTIAPLSEADVGRRTKWPEYRQSMKDTMPLDLPKSKQEHETDMKWLSNVEISTHSPHLRLLWIGCPQFSFRTYQPTSTPSSSSPPSRSTDLSTSPLTSYTDQELNSKGIAIPSIAASNSTVSNSPGSAMEVLFDENAMIPTKRIDIRRRDPLPFKDSLDDLHEASSSPQTDDLIKESLLDAISTSMISDEQTNSSNFDLIKSDPNIAQAGSRKFNSSPVPPTTSPTPSRTYNSHVSTSTSSLFPPLGDTVQPSYASTNAPTVPNYYSPYTPPTQYTSTTTATTPSTNPLRTAVSSPLTTSSVVPTSPIVSSISPETSSPKTFSSQSTPPQPAPSRTTSASIPIGSAGLKTSSPFSSSPPFPESELPAPKKNGNNQKSTKEEDEEELAPRNTTKKKKKHKGKHKNGDREQNEDETET